MSFIIGMVMCYVDWLLAGLGCQQPVDATHDYTSWFSYRVDPPDDDQQACSKHVEAYYWNKLIEDSASCWFMLYGYISLNNAFLMAVPTQDVIISVSLLSLYLSVGFTLPHWPCLILFILTRSVQLIFSIPLQRHISKLPKYFLSTKICVSGREMLKLLLTMLCVRMYSGFIWQVTGATGRLMWAR